MRPDVSHRELTGGVPEFGKADPGPVVPGCRGSLKQQQLPCSPEGPSLQRCLVLQPGHKEQRPVSVSPEGRPHIPWLCAPDQVLKTPTPTHPMRFLTCKIIMMPLCPQRR